MTERRSGPAAESAHLRAHRTELADLVVLLALLRVADDVVRSGDLLEALLRPGIGVGVVLLGELAVGARQLLLGRCLRTHRERVVVLLEPFTLRGHSLSFLIVSRPHRVPGRIVRVRRCSSLTRAPAPWPGGSPGPSTCNRASSTSVTTARPDEVPPATSPGSESSRLHVLDRVV